MLPFFQSYISLDEVLPSLTLSCTPTCRIVNARTEFKMVSAKLDQYPSVYEWICSLLLAYSIFHKSSTHLLSDEIVFSSSSSSFFFLFSSYPIYQLLLYPNCFLLSVFSFSVCTEYEFQLFTWLVTRRRRRMSPFVVSFHSPLPILLSSVVLIFASLYRHIESKYWSNIFLRYISYILCMRRYVTNVFIMHTTQNTVEMELHIHAVHCDYYTMPSGN